MLEADRFLADLNERAPDLDMSPPAFEATSRSRGLPDEKRSAVWNKGPISIDLRTVGVELEVSTCFLADGVWSIGSVYDASALNHLLSTAIGCGARRFARPRGCKGGGKSERSPRVRPKQAEFRRAAITLPPPSGPPGCPLQLRPVREHWFDDVATDA